MRCVVAIIGAPELVGILVILLVMFNADKISRRFNGMNHGFRDFIKATREVQDDVNEALGNYAADKHQNASHQHEFVFWLLVAIVVITCAVSLGLP